MTKCGPNTCNELDCGYNLGLSENWALIITQRLIIISHWWPFWKTLRSLPFWDKRLGHPTPNPSKFHIKPPKPGVKPSFFQSNHHCLMVKSPKSPLVDSQDRPCRATTAAFQRPRRHLALYRVSLLPFSGTAMFFRDACGTCNHDG